MPGTRTTKSKLRKLSEVTVNFWQQQVKLFAAIYLSLVYFFLLPNEATKLCGTFGATIDVN